MKAEAAFAKKRFAAIQQKPAQQGVIACNRRLMVPVAVILMNVLADIAGWH